MFETLRICLLFAGSSMFFGQQHFTLAKSDVPRFQLIDHHSSKIGEPLVCLWEDDKIAAFTLTIDDNNEQDVPFWKSMQQKYGYPFTWFLITGAKDESLNVKNWNLFRELYQNGNAIQGHDHRNYAPEITKNSKFLADYSNRLKSTQDKINQEIGGKNCLTYAFPWGEGNPEVAEKYFIANRGVVGLINQANQVDYSNVRSVSNPHIFKNNASRDKYFLPILNKTNLLENENYYRGWLSVHFHSITNDEKMVDEFLSYIKEKDKKLWVSTFPNIAKYSQEYATHKIENLNISKEKISFNLKDQMQDSAFDYPLSIRIKIPNYWEKVSVSQNNNSIFQKIEFLNNEKFLLIKAVPDRGTIIIEQKENPLEESLTSNEFYIPSTISPQAQELLKTFKRENRNASSFPSQNAPLEEWKILQKNVDENVKKGLQPILDKYHPKIETIYFNGIRAVKITPQSYKKSKNIIVYVHGGGFVLLSADVTLASMLPLAESIGIPIIAVDYTLAPNKKNNEILNEMVDFYKGLLKEYQPENISVYGDSAGGSIAAATMLKLRDLKIALPSSLILWSPWTDIAEIGDTYSTLANNDPTVIYKNFLENSALAYAPKEEFKNPFVSPVYGDYSKNFPPTLIQVGSKEIFLSNAIRFYRVLNENNKDVKLDIYEGMWHVFQGYYELPESKTALENTKKFMLNHFKNK